RSWFPSGSWWTSTVDAAPAWAPSRRGGAGYRTVLAEANLMPHEAHPPRGAARRAPRRVRGVRAELDAEGAAGTVRGRGTDRLGGRVARGPRRRARGGAGEREAGVLVRADARGLADGPQGRDRPLHARRTVLV